MTRRLIPVLFMSLLAVSVVLILSYLLESPPPVSAQGPDGFDTYYVTTDGDCGAGATPCFDDLQEAIDAVDDPADVIKVAAGAYDEVHAIPWAVNPLYPFTTHQVAFISKSLTLKGGYLTGSWATPNPEVNVTTLDAGGQGRGIYIVSGKTVVLEGLRVVNGVGSQNETGAPWGGGGIGVEDYNANGRLTLRNCELRDNEAHGGLGSGGGLFFHGGALVVESTDFISNTSSSFGGGFYVRNAVVTMTHTLVKQNYATGMGGGGDIYESQSYVAYNTFEENISDWDGGGLGMTWGDTTLTHNTFLNNVADDGGGGFKNGGLGESDTYTITYNLFQGNIGSRSGTATGGGVTISGGGALLFAYNQLLANVGSDVDMATGAGGGGYIHGPARVVGNLIQDNRGCTGLRCNGRGGGLVLRGHIWLEGNRILNNIATVEPCEGFWCAGGMQGGGLFISNQSAITMTNNIIAGNAYADIPRASGDNGGGALYIGGQTDPTDSRAWLYHNTIADNLPPAILSESAGLNMSHNIFANHDTDIKTMKDSSGIGPAPATALDYTLWWPAQTFDLRDGSLIATAHDIVGTPAFSSRAGDDYHIGAGSQALDRGPGVGITVDIDGDPRPIRGAYDLGADEVYLLFLPLTLSNATP